MRKEATYLRKIMNTKKSAEPSDRTCYLWQHTESGYNYVTDRYTVTRFAGATPQKYQLISTQGDYTQYNRRAKPFAKTVTPLPAHDLVSWNLPQDHDVAFTVDSDEVKAALRAAKYLHSDSVWFWLDYERDDILTLHTESFERGDYKFEWRGKGYPIYANAWDHTPNNEVGRKHKFSVITYANGKYTIPYKPLLDVCVSSTGNITVYAKNENIDNEVLTTALVRHTVGATEFETMLSNRHKES